jgi:hypothetical protein
MAIIAGSTADRLLTELTERVRQINIARAHRVNAAIDEHTTALKALRAERRNHVAEMSAHGLSLAEIGRLYRLTAERVRQLVAEAAAEFACCDVDPNCVHAQETNRRIAEIREGR